MDKKTKLNTSDLKNATGGSSPDLPAFCGPFKCPHCGKETYFTYIPRDAHGKEGDVTATCVECLGTIEIKLGAGL